MGTAYTNQIEGADAVGEALGGLGAPPPIPHALSRLPPKRRIFSLVLSRLECPHNLRDAVYV